MNDPFDNAAQSLRIILNSNIDVIVIPDYDANPEPQGTYGTLGVSFFNQISREQNSTDTSPVDALNETLATDYEVTFDVNFYGKDASIKAMDAHSVFGFNSVKGDLHYTYGLGFMRIGNIRRVPELRSSRYVPRYTFDVTFTANHEAIRQIDYFDTVDYQGDYVDLEGNVVVTQSGTIDVDVGP